MRDTSTPMLARVFRRVEAVSDRELMLLTGAFLWAFSGIATAVAGIVNPEIVPDPVVAWRIGCAVLATFVVVSIFTWMKRLDDVRLMHWIIVWASVAALLHAVLMIGQPLNISSLYVGLLAPTIFVAAFLSRRAFTIQLVLLTACLLIPTVIGYTEVPEEHVLSRTVAFAPIIWAVGATVFLLQANRLRALKVLADVAGTDPLTGVANLHNFETHGRELFDQRNARIAKPVGLLLVDLDDFKSINTKFGHAGGDLALREVGAALKGAQLPGHLVARIGGDEFAILIEDAEPAALASLAEHYAAAVASVERSDLLGGGIKASIGAASSPLDGTSLDQLTEAADASMYEKKQSKHAPQAGDSAVRIVASAQSEPVHAAGGRIASSGWQERPLYTRLATLGWISAATIGLVGLAMPDAVRGDVKVSLAAVASGYLIAVLAWISKPPTTRWMWVRNDGLALAWIAWVSYLTGGAYSALWPLVTLFIALDAWLLDSRRIWSRVPFAFIVILAPLAYSDLGSISKPTGASLYAGVLCVFGVTLVLSFLQDNRERAERESKRLAIIDPRTSLLNRREFERRAELALDAAAQSGDAPSVAIAMLDLDHFKEVNTRHGHGAGDQLLETIGAALGTCTREGDSLARIGGDEFAVLLLGVDAETATELTARYVEAIDLAVAPNPLPACRAVSATADIAIHGVDGATLDELLTCADGKLMASKALRDNAASYASSDVTA